MFASAAIDYILHVNPLSFKVVPLTSISCGCSVTYLRQTVENRRNTSDLVFRVTIVTATATITAADRWAALLNINWF